MEGTRARHPRSPPHSPPPDLCQVLPLPRRLSGLRRLLCSSRVPEMPEGVGATDRQRHDLLQAARGNQPHLQHARQREAGQRGFLLVRGSHSQRASRTSHTRCCRCRCCYRCPPPPCSPASVPPGWSFIPLLPGCEANCNVATGCSKCPANKSLVKPCASAALCASCKDMGCPRAACSSAGCSKCPKGKFKWRAGDEKAGFDICVL